MLFEGLAVALEALPPFKGRLVGLGLGSLTPAGQLGAGFAALLAEPGGLGRPVLVPGVVGFDGRLLRTEEIGEGVQGPGGRLVALGPGLGSCLPLVCFRQGRIFQLSGNVLRTRGIGSPRVLLLRLEFTSGHGLVQLFLVLDLQVRDRVFAHPFAHWVTPVRSQGDCPRLPCRRPRIRRGEGSPAVPGPIRERGTRPACWSARARAFPHTARLGR